MDRFDEHVRWLAAAPIYAAAYGVALLVFWWQAHRRGMAGPDVARVLAAGLIGGLAGAGILQLVATGLPGKTIEGGIAGGWLAVVWAKRQFGVTRPTGDLFALAIPAGEAIGRIACFVGGCCYGRVAQGLAWAVHDHDAFRHPAQLYLALGAALSFAVLVWAQRRLRLPENGLFYLGGMLFCIDRFAIEFFRAAPVPALGMTLAQLAALAGFAVFAWKFAALVADRSENAGEPLAVRA